MTTSHDLKPGQIWRDREGDEWKVLEDLTVAEEPYRNVHGSFGSVDDLYGPLQLAGPRTEEVSELEARVLAKLRDEHLTEHLQAWLDGQAQLVVGRPLPEILPGGYPIPFKIHPYL